MAPNRRPYGLGIIMLGIGGKFASSKGMVKVPDLSGKTRQEAKDALIAANLKFGTESSVSNDVGSGSNGKVASQSIAKDTLIDYESTVSFNYYGTYSPPVFVTGSIENCVQNTRLVYLSFGGFTYGPCINGKKQVSSTRNYAVYVSQTCTTTTYYSDGTSYTSPAVTYPEQYVGDESITRSDGVQAC